MTGERTRKPNGRSSIFLGADGRWHGFVTMGLKADGSPDRRHVKRKSEKSATDAVRELEKQRDAGRVRRPGRAPTVEEWMATYLDTIAVRKVTPRTHDDYWSKTRNWIIPHLGQHRLDRLDPEHLDTMYAAMFRKGLAASHVLKVHRILSRALKIAVRRGKISVNVAEMIDPPSSQSSDQESLTREEARRVLAAASELRNGVRWSVGLACGLRQGEALGLRWEFIDLETGDARIGGRSSATPGGMAAMIHTRVERGCIASGDARGTARSTRPVPSPVPRAARATRVVALSVRAEGWSSADPRASHDG